MDLAADPCPSERSLITQCFKNYKIITSAAPGFLERPTILPTPRKTRDMPAPKPTKAAIERALSAARSVGFTPTSFRIGPDGSLTIDMGAGELNPAANQQAGPEDAKAPKKWGQKR